MADWDFIKLAQELVSGFAQPRAAGIKAARRRSFCILSGRQVRMYICSWVTLFTP